MAGKLILSQPPFAYRAGKTILHRAPAGFKFLCVIVFSALCFASIPALIAAIVLVITSAATARVSPRQLLRGSKPLAVMSLIIVLTKTIHPWTSEIINMKGLFDGNITVLRIFVSYATAALLFTVTSMRELRHSLTAVELSLKKTFVRSKAPPNTAFFSLGISLMLGFIPRFFDLWETSNLALQARSGKRGLRRLFLLIPLVTERMMETAADTALALQARGVGNNHNRK